MKRTTIVTMLLTAMLSAMGCAGNDVVRKDEGPVPVTRHTTALAGKDVPVQPVRPATAAAAATPSADPAAGRIVPADNLINPAQQTAPAGIVYFGFDSYVLTAESGNTLQAHFNRLAGRPAIQIDGHCDEQGSSEYNLALGEKRAGAARNYLVTLGYPAGKISVISYGKERPAAAGHDEAAWAKNRRDELRIVK